jgi:hypothetical protein
MSVTYKAKVKEYITSAGDIWDIIALKCYGDEHCMNVIQDANYNYRFHDRFQANIVLAVPETATIETNHKTFTIPPNVKALLPWR